MPSPANHNEIRNIVDSLNQHSTPNNRYKSPPAGQLVSRIPAWTATPYNVLEQGTRLLISLADSLHDLSKTEPIKLSNGNYVTKANPGVLTLKAWCRNMISRYHVSTPGF